MSAIKACLSLRTVGVLVIALGLWACEPTPSLPPPEPPPSPSEAPKPSLFLEVQSPEGASVPGVEVRLKSGGHYKTDAQGQLLLKELELGENPVQVEVEGFAPTAQTFTLAEPMRAGSRIQLLPLGPSMTFDAMQGAALESGGISVEIPPGSLLDAEGRPLEGEVEAFFRALDLEKDELHLSPGEQLGVVDPSLPPVPLESLGVMVLDFRRKSSALRALAQGPHAQDVTAFRARVQVRGRAPGSIRIGSSLLPGGVQASMLAEPRTWRVPIWRLNERTGYWEYTEALGTLEESATEPGTYTWKFEMAQLPRVINVAQPYWWRAREASADNPLKVPTPAWVETACLRVTVRDTLGTPVGGRTVVAQGVDYVGLSRGTTGSDGSVSLAVMRDREVKVASGDMATRVQAGSLAGDCHGQGAEPTPVVLEVPRPLCVPGEESACAYHGPRETQGVGDCRAASRYCNAEGSAWGNTCLGEVLPQQERCDTEGDEDCDGVSNEGCASLCREGDTQPCYEGAAGTENVGACRGGTKTCVARGTAWSACVGQVLPEATESCSLPEDEDCDGVTCLCRPGETQRCGYAGPAGTENVGVCRASFKTCNDSGTGWSGCTGEVTPQPESCLTLEDEDCDGQVNQSSFCVCMPNSSQDCPYSGPAGTQNVGVCRAGTQTCNASGTTWGACSGEVLPLAEESCTTDVDDDCDGQVNEGSVCVCVPNSSQDCPYSGPAGTLGVGVCRAGTQACNASGTAWGACSGEVTPQPESCVSAGDEDCDGQRNEAPPCGWVTAASLSEARSHHQAVVLDTGEVLVMGGVNPSDVRLSSAELYDPATRTWTPTASMNVARRNFAAVKLNSGKVLVMGGWGLSGQLKSAEVYDPGNGSWTAVPDMLTAREKLAATLLGNGKVLVTGGNTQNAEVYDPSSGTYGTWTAATSMNVSRADHTATLLDDGKVLVAGGYNGSAMDKTAEVYDPAAGAGGTWNYVGNMNSMRTVHAATLLSNGKVLVMGGYNGTVTVKSAELYDPVNKSWTTTGSMSTVRDEPRALRLSSGHVLVTGGDDTATATATAELYDPEAKTWTPLSSMIAARSAHTMVVLSTGEVLVAGGWAGTALATAEVYNTTSQQTNTWRPTSSMAVPRRLHTATVLNNGKVLVVGGRESGSVTTSSAELYDPSTGTWTNTGSLHGPRHTHTATLLNNGKVLVAGGTSDGDQNVLATAELYDPDAGTWTVVDNMGTARREHTATLLANGKVLVTGGHNASLSLLDTAELYDPDAVSNKWTATTGNMSTPREKHAAVRLKNGQVLVIGGHIGTGNYVNTAEVYNPNTGQFTTTSSMAVGRNWFTATVLNDTAGSVFVVGGFNLTNQFLSTAEVYDPGSPGWSLAGTGAMASAREKHTTVQLDTQRVLVVGGNASGDLKTAEVYDLNSRTWSLAAPMSEARSLHTMVLLGDGRVLVTGGRKGTGALKTAELYKP